jgi:Fe2+ or Zn2+ uptake regulation protein
MTDKCIQSAAEEHDFVMVKKEWQTIDYTQYQYLNHRKEILVCTKCGKVIDPWEEKKKK